MLDMAVEEARLLKKLAASNRGNTWGTGTGTGSFLWALDE